MNRSTSEQIGTKQSDTREGIEVILSFCSKCRRGLQALVLSGETLRSFSRPGCVLVTLFLPCSGSGERDRGEIDIPLANLISAAGFSVIYRLGSLQDFIIAVSCAHKEVTWELYNLLNE